MTRTTLPNMQVSQALRAVQFCLNNLKCDRIGVRWNSVLCQARELVAGKVCDFVLFKCNTCPVCIRPFSCFSQIQSSQGCHCQSRGRTEASSWSSPSKPTHHPHLLPSARGRREIEAMDTSMHAHTHLLKRWLEVTRILWEKIRTALRVFIFELIGVYAFV